MTTTSQWLSRTFSGSATSSGASPGVSPMTSKPHSFLPMSHTHFPPTTHSCPTFDPTFDPTLSLLAVSAENLQFCSLTASTFLPAPPPSLHRTSASSSSAGIVDMATMLCNLADPSHKLVRFPNLLLVSQLGNLTIKKHNSTPLSLSTYMSTM